MIRAFFAAASGMRAQQKSIDLIAHNIANVNTNGFKAKKASFKDLVYSSMEIRRVAAPPNLQVGNGVRVGATVRSLVQGAQIETGNTFDVSIAGNGFFVVAGRDGTLRYTRDGGFNISVRDTGEGFENRLVTSDGLFVLNSDGRPVEFAAGTDVSTFKIAQDGTITASNVDGEAVSLGRLAVVGFSNPRGLAAAGNNLFVETEASGTSTAIEEPNVTQRFIEASNVDLANEMTRLIMAQRAYQLSARVLRTADDMESIANNLRR